MAFRSLYAVLAGIDQYRLPVSSLEGCHHDVCEWNEYLNKESETFNLDITILLNSEVTKKALTSSLQQALSRASSTDVVFFFFSGHGTREKADPVFSDIEQDNALESLVCYDSVVEQQGNRTYNLLSDKEIQFILSNYGKDGTHIVMVFDCCHSGGITRNDFPGRKSTCRERRYVPSEWENFIAPMRLWKDFLFGEIISHDDISNTGWLERVKQRPHIVLSACQNDESAFETEGQGVFTKNIIDILHRTKGSLTYYDLQSRARLFIQNQFRQTPEIYTVIHHEDDLLKIFLDKTAPQKDLGCTIYYKSFTGWVMDLGAVQGISSYSGPVLIELNKIVFALQIREVFSNYTRLELPDGLDRLLSREQAYRASVKNHFANNTAFFIQSALDGNEVLGQLKTNALQWILDHDAPFSIAETQVNSTYVISATDDKIQICQNDIFARPATEIPLNDTEPTNHALMYMRHIAQWEYIRSLCNPGFVGNEYPIRIQFFRMASDQIKKEMFSSGDTLVLEYDTTSSGIRTGKLKVSLTNLSNVKYYCSLLYLSNLFQAYGNLLDGKVVGLGPGETSWVYNGSDIELDLEKHIVEYNYEYSIFYLKLLACTRPFLVETLEQSPLPAPTLQNKKGDIMPGNRIPKTRIEKAEKNINWFTRTICIKCRNPHYSSIQKTQVL